MSVPDRGPLLDHDHKQLSVRRQCRPRGNGRSGVHLPEKRIGSDTPRLQIIDDLAGQPRPDPQNIPHALWARNVVGNGAGGQDSDVLSQGEGLGESVQESG